MSKAAVSVDDARLQALLETLRGGGGEVVPALRDFLDHVLEGPPNAPAHPAAVDALLSAGLTSLLLSWCTRANPGRWPFGALARATCVREAARYEVGPAGFVQMLGLAEHDAALAPFVIPVLRNTACSASVKTAVFEEVGRPTLRRLFALGDRFPTNTCFGTVNNLLHGAWAAALHASFQCGVVTWLEKHLRRFVCQAPNPVVARRLLQICQFFLQTPNHREAMRPLYYYFTTSLSLFSRLPLSDELASLAVNAARGLRLCANDMGTPRSAIAVSLVLDPAWRTCELGTSCCRRSTPANGQRCKADWKLLVSYFLRGEILGSCFPFFSGCFLHAPGPLFGGA